MDPPRPRTATLDIIWGDLLVLNHISGRYPEEEILAEAAMIFPDSRVAADFDRFVV